MKAADEIHSSIHVFGTPLIIGPGGYYAVRINDDLTGLAQHYFRVHGMRVTLNKDLV